MNLLQSRIGVYLAPTTAVWTGTVSSYSTTTFVVTVNTVSGSLNAVLAGMALMAGTRYIRVRAVDAGAGTITLAENPANLVASDAVSVRPGRFPFPRYQFISDAGVIYKDYDVAYPGANAAMPPIACCVPEVIIAATGESVSVSADDSAGIAPSSTPLTYAWDAGTNGTVTGSGSDVTVSWSAAGFRYLKLTVTDALGTSSVRYIPAWIGMAAFEDVTSARLSYRDGGWEAEIEVVVPPVYVQRSPVAIVDLDTDEVLFFGWMQQQTLSYDDEMSTLRFESLGAWSYTTRIYSYPFILTKESSPDEWSEILSLDLRRALWVLLYWHSTLPQLVNVVIPETRAIEGQDFQAGTLRAQADEVLAAAFWQAFSARAGGITIDANPLYEADWTGYTNEVLDGTEVVGQIEQERPISDISEARLSGVYYSSGWVPLIVRAPVHPEDLGTPVEVTGLAPADAAELRLWAGRHIAAAKALIYDLETTVAIDPVTDVIIELPDGTEICLDEIELTHDAKSLAWTQTLGGRTFDDAPSTADEDPPPEIEIPDPEFPPIDPPIWDPLPEEAWPSIVYAATLAAGVFVTKNIVDPEAIQPTWETANVGLPTLDCREFALDPFAPEDRQYVMLEATRTLYRREDEGSWTAILTSAQIASLVGQATTAMGFCVDAATAGRVWVIAKADAFWEPIWALRSDDYGDNWTATVVQAGYYTYSAYGIRAYGSRVFARVNCTGGALAYVHYSTDGGATWAATHIDWNADNPIWLNPLSPDGVYAMTDNTGNQDLSRVTNSGGNTLLQDGLSPARWDAMWFDPSDVDHQRLLRGGYMHVTTDGWSGTNAPDAVSPTPISIAPYSYSNEQTDIIFVGLTITGGTPPVQPHAVGILLNEDDVTATGIAGANAGTSPFTDSIPYTCGGIAIGGIQAIP
jgi:hypothetical protein